MDPYVALNVEFLRAMQRGDLAVARSVAERIERIAPGNPSVRAFLEALRSRAQAVAGAPAKDPAGTSDAEDDDEDDESGSEGSEASASETGFEGGAAPDRPSTEGNSSQARGSVRPQQMSRAVAPAAHVDVEAEEPPYDEDIERQIEELSRASVGEAAKRLQRLGIMHPNAPPPK